MRVERLDPVRANVRAYSGCSQVPTADGAANHQCSPDDDVALVRQEGAFPATETLPKENSR